MYMYVRYHELQLTIKSKRIFFYKDQPTKNVSDRDPTSKTN